MGHVSDKSERERVRESFGHTSVGWFFKIA